MGQHAPERVGQHELERWSVCPDFAPTRLKAATKNPSLFKDEGIYRKYRYSCFITNLNLPAEQIWTLYRQRADAENRIKGISIFWIIKF